MASELLFIRCDATTQTKTGHVMRCLAIAEAWNDGGGEVVFISRIENKAVRQRILESGFEVVALKHNHPHPDDTKHTIEILEKNSTSTHNGRPWLILDGYHFDVDYQKNVRKACRLAAIDDYQHLDAYHADILLNQNIHAEKIKYVTDDDTLLLMGLKYALLRPEFSTSWKKSKKINDTAGHILVTMGGEDTENVTLNVVEALKLMKRYEIHVRLILGPANKNIDSLQRALSQTSFDMKIIANEKNMARQMEWADIAITAGGVTCTELAAMGVPMVIITIAENQISGAAGLSEEKAAVCIGWHQDLSPGDIASTIRHLLDNQDLRKILSIKSRKLVDGQGAHRLIEQIATTRLKLRRAMADDCRKVWEWANDSLIRSSSFHSDPIPFENHCRWYEDKIKSRNTIFYIADNQNGIPIGQARFDFIENEAVISVSMGSNFRRLGIGHRLIRKASEECLRKRNPKRIIAMIKYDNTASVSAFEKAGFQKIEDTFVNRHKTLRMEYKKAE